MRKKIIKEFCGVLMALSVAFPTAAGVSDLPVKQVNGKAYHYYEVQPRETVYSLVRKLGISQEELYRTNPSVRDGLKAYAVLLFPVDTKSVTTTVTLNPGAATHKVTRGETVYGISKKYGVSTADIFEWNPSTRDGLKAGTTIYVSDPRKASTLVAESEQPAPAPEEAEEMEKPVETISQPEAAQTMEYIVKARETFYSIARDHGLSISGLEALNPGVGAVHEGVRILVPAQPQPQPVIAAVEEIEESVNTDDSPATDLPVRKSINIALMLPLETEQASKSKQAPMYAEYLRGFMLAADSLRSRGKEMNIRVFDTHNSIDSLQAILRGGSLDGLDLIVAPNNETHLRLVGEYGRRNNVRVFNPFVVKDDSYLNNPMMMQANIPQQMMYDKAISGLITRYADYYPVFVGRTDGPDDKAGFLQELRKAFDKAGIQYSDLKIENRLSRSDLSALPTGKHILIIPESGRQSEVTRIFPALIDFKEAGNQIVVFGYPEWTAFKGETLANMRTLGAVVYSRFFLDEESPATKNIERQYDYWYGGTMAPVLPRQGILGFDSGYFLLNSMINGDDNFSATDQAASGVQNSYRFISPDGAQGMVNNILYLIKFNADGSVERIKL